MRKAVFMLLCLGLALSAFAGEELAVGTAAPKFSLVNAVDNKTVKFEPASGKVSVLIFTCNQCPYAKAFEPRIVEIAKEYQAKGVAFYAINPNDDARYDIESMDNMKERATSKGFVFPYLKDTNSYTARLYGARVTPHVFVVDGKGVIRYRGYVDDSAKPEERTNAGLTNALDALLANRDVANASTRAFGCSIKWKS
jgi:thiol-disulfide isomerase/thioredoxin